MKVKTIYTEDHGPVVSMDDFDILQRSHNDLLKALEEALPGIEELNGEFQTGWETTIDLMVKVISKAKGL